MKKYAIQILCLAGIFFISCNSEEKKKSNDDTAIVNTQSSAANDQNWVNDYFENDGCQSIGGMGNFILRTSLADSMIYHFDTIYKRDDSHTDARAFLNSYWIDSCTVSAIADFLRTSGQHDGIRIYFGCALQNDPAYGTDQYKKKSTLFIFPTIKRTSTSPEVSEHGDNLIPIPIPTTCLFRSEYIKPAGSATAEIGEFSKVYCKSTNPVAKQKDSLSKAIWIDSCVIYFIQKTLRKNSATVDGINIRTAAYFDNFTTTIKGRFKPNQSTIIIVPSSPGATGSHTDNWQITEDIFNVTKRIKKIKGAFNHGELCPKACE